MEIDQLREYHHLFQLGKKARAVHMVHTVNAEERFQYLGPARLRLDKPEYHCESRSDQSPEELADGLLEV